MTQNEKELLLKDLCARLPYGIKIEYNGDVRDLIGITLGRVSISKTFYDKDVEDIKPYLLPLSSMTEAQKRDYQYITERWMNDPTYTIGDSFDWLNKNHFDYRGLIEKGLAIDATELNIY